jgi:oligopeptide/dipeptide ABC transporter ATP-binding protein
MDRDIILRVENLAKHFRADKGTIRAVDSVSFDVMRGETFGCAGESGCGKSTLALTMLRLIESTAGCVYFEGQDIFSLKRNEMKQIRRRFQVVFQDPYSSLPPRWSVQDIVREPLIINSVGTKEKQKEIVVHILDAVGLKKLTNEKVYPDQLSGGERQRVAIARALVLNPYLVICDEPISSLDVSIQAQILNLLIEMKSNYNLSYFFITHDLRVLRFFSDRIAIMYLGRIVEMASNNDIFSDPLHPYTNLLINSSPSIEKQLDMSSFDFIKGELPNPFEINEMCGFCTRCSQKMDICLKTKPELVEYKPGHHVACFLYSDAER